MRTFLTIIAAAAMAFAGYTLHTRAESSSKNQAEQVLPRVSAASDELQRVSAERVLETQAELLRASQLPDWDEFYHTCKQLRVGNQTLRRMIIHRIASVHELSQTEVRSLAELLDREISAVSGAAAMEWGSMEVVEGMALTLEGDENREFWTRLKAIREQIRRQWDSQFAGLLGGEASALVDVHLRNAEIWISKESSQESVKRFVGGFGQ